MGIIKRYIQEEGIRLDPYKDTKDKLTGGIGHLMSPSDIQEFQHNWSYDQKAKYWLNKFEDDIEEARGYAIKELTGEYPEKLLEILTDLKFNMGPTRFNPQKWPSFYKALAVRDYEKAAYELLHNSSGGPSKWLLDVKERANKIAGELRSLG